MNEPHRPLRSRVSLGTRRHLPWLLAVALGLALYSAIPTASAEPPPKKDGAGRNTTTSTTTAPRQATKLMVEPPVYVADTPGVWVPNYGPCLNYDGCADESYYGVRGGTRMTAHLTTAKGVGLAFKYVEMSNNGGGFCGTRTDISGMSTCEVANGGVPTSVHARFAGDAIYEPSEGRF